MSAERKGMPYQMIRGYPCPVSEFFTKKNIEDAMDYMPSDGDLVLASYPKTGTTWMQYILLQIKSKGESFPSIDEVTFKVVPYVEMTGIAPVLQQNRPRFYKHHLSYDHVQKNDKSKVVYTYRNPEDTIVSFYRFASSLFPDVALDFDQFFHDFVAGEIFYGNYFRHVLSFYERRDDGNLLMVSYEKLHANRKEEILKIAKFLDREHFRNLTEDRELLENIIRRTTFDYMKKNLYVIHPKAATGIGEVQREEENEKVNFFRKGIVGDGKAVLSEQQRRILKETAEKVLKGTAIFNEWYSN